MKERPIIFNTNMVKAILEGRKTQTRRVVKEKLISEQAEFECGNRPNVTRSEPSLQYYIDNGCPFGQIGDRLWVRETFRFYNSDECPHADFPCSCPRNGTPLFKASHDCGDGEKWKPSIHMPRWASRILLEITNIRVERLNDISQADSSKEGIVDGCCLRCRFEACRCKDRQPDLIQGFAREWSNENGFFPTEKWVSYGGKAWRDNPWVWVVEFKVIQGGES
ncbi:hypothetical protein [Acinetobacter seifertii]|uniref:hypothetical protein n=1 Tax=Acinetobacter seifertii TaxID=1530123 RepID=UPI001CCF5E1D|nr:hypothetical protein [Acinetobacter seifertii]MBZ6534018.1 hypothetical protein [Acinetobacter seifertii]